MAATSFYGQEAATVPNFSRWRSDQKLPLSHQSAWALLAFSHLVGLCHPFPLTNSPVQIIIAHENKENATAQLEILGTGEMSQACSVFHSHKVCMLTCSTEAEIS